MTKKQRITNAALEILHGHSSAIRYSELLRLVGERFPDEAPDSGNLRGAIWNLERRCPDDVFKPGRGLFQHTRFRGHGESPPPADQSGTESDRNGPPPEAAFYAPFAEYLVQELDECTKAIPLGGNRFRSKWGTPDVVGIYRSRESDIVKWPLSLTSAEIKVNTSELITAYGQACAYRLFSHRTYLVIPRSSNAEDIERLDSLCTLSGVGLILFDAQSRHSPAFAIRVRAAKQEPDIFYLNFCIALVKNELEL